MTAKRDKNDVQYGLGHIHSHCGPTLHDDKYYCTHFIKSKSGDRGECELVAGEIRRDHWCRLYHQVGNP